MHTGYVKKTQMHSYENNRTMYIMYEKPHKKVSQSEIVSSDNLI